MADDIGGAKKQEDWQKRVLDAKWVELEKRGLTRPKDSAENAERAKAAHGY